MSNATANGTPRIVATYDYRDERGVLLYQSVRFEPKDFRQRRPAGKDKWAWNLQGVRRVLYNLPELLAAPPERPVFVVEGEKDVENLRQIEVLATTNAMGAGKWLPEYGEALRGRHVVVLPDNDRAGREHAEAVARSLDGVAASVLVVEPPGLPEKGNVSDWLAAEGNDKRRLLELVAAAQDSFSVPPPREGTENELKEPFRVIPCSQLEGTAEERQWQWEGYLSLGAVTLLSALFKAGKTTLLAHLLRAVEQGGAFLGKPAQACRVLYVSEERESRWAERRDKLGLGDWVEFVVRPFPAKPNRGEWLGFLKWLKARQEARRYDLIVFDTLSNLWPVRDENDAAQVQEALMPIHTAIGDAALLLVHHLRKSDGGEGTGSRGSGALLGWVDIIVELRRFDAEDEKSTRRVLTGYGRYEETPATVVVKLEDGRYIAEGDRGEVRVMDVRADLGDILPTEPPGLTVNEVVENWQRDRTPRRSDLLTALRSFARTGGGKKGDPHRYYRAENAVPDSLGTESGTTKNTAEKTEKKRQKNSVSVPTPIGGGTESPFPDKPAGGGEWA
jgi:hypothetical protein